MAHNREWFAMLDGEKQWGKKVALAYMVKGQGIVLIKMPNGDIKQVHDVLYVLELTRNFLSVNQIAKQYSKEEFEKGK